MGAAEKMDGAAQCPSAMAIDSWVLRGRAETDPIREHVKACARCEALVAEFDGAADVFRREVFPATVEGVTARARDLSPGDRLSAFLFRRNVRLAFAVVTAVCVMAVGGYLYQDLPRTHGAYTGVKGGLGLTVFVNHAGTVRQLGDNETLSEGDALRLVPSVPSAGYLMVVSVEESGRLNVYYPAGGESAMKVAAGAEPLPGSVILDKSAGAERVFVLYSPEPFALPQVRDAAGRAKGQGVAQMTRLPLDLSQATFFFRKGGGR